MDVDVIGNQLIPVQCDTFIALVKSSEMSCRFIDYQGDADAEFSEGEIVVVKKDIVYPGNLQNLVIIIDDPERRIGNLLFQALKQAEKIGSRAVGILSMRLSSDMQFSEKIDAVDQVVVAITQFDYDYPYPVNVKEAFIIMENADDEAFEMFKRRLFIPYLHDKR